MKNKEEQIIMHELKSFLKLKNQVNSDTDVYVLYGGFIPALLSKTLFPKNSDVKNFLENNDILFKDYVYSSRTQVVARIARIIEKMSNEEKKKLFISLETEIDHLDEQEIVEKKAFSKKSVKKNTVDELLVQFGRK